MTKITVKALINVPIEKVWILWNEPTAVMKWNSASEDWHCPKAENSLIEGGTFCYTMAAKDGSFSFDFGGTYDKIIPHQLMKYTLGDERTVSVSFVETPDGTEITEIFDAEKINPIDMQQAGWQAILNNFKKFAEQ